MTLERSWVRSIKFSLGLFSFGLFSFGLVCFLCCYSLFGSPPFHSFAAQLWEVAPLALSSLLKLRPCIPRKWFIWSTANQGLAPIRVNSY